jgi:hypothetical protein
VKHAAFPRLDVRAIWLALGLLTAVYAAHEGVGLGGSATNDLFDQWLNDALLWAAAAMCLAGAVRSTRSRAAWLLVTAGLASWATGDAIWSLRFGDAAHTPLTSVSDVFWLAWYPLILAALVLLVRDRVPVFELHRWIDGVVVMLLVATPWLALVLQPVAEHSGASTLSDIVDFAYPTGDAIVVGAALGVFVLMAWRPGRMWLILSAGLVAMGIADAFYSVQALGQSYRGGVYDAAWIAGAVLVAYAAWEPHPERVEPREVTGWQAVALPVAAQILAASIQFYGLFEEIPTIERALTVAVLLIATLQIILTRPRPRTDVAGVEASFEHDPS